MAKKITLQIKGQIALIQINRPEVLNALNREIIDDLDEMIEQIKEDKSIEVLIIGGTENFAAGADIKQMVECNPAQAAKFLFSYTYNKVEDLRIPTIAAIDGYALGGGLELALTCDLRIATKEAKMGLPETGIGIMPGAGGTVRLPRTVGMSKAKEMVFLGALISGEEAERIGLVNKVVEKDELMPTAMKWAEKLTQRAPIAISVAKSMLEDGMKTEIKSGVDLEAERWSNLFYTYDQKEGMRAFNEKRKPVYKGE